MFSSENDYNAQLKKSIRVTCISERNAGELITNLKKKIKTPPNFNKN
jgi:hypothetical protein